MSNLNNSTACQIDKYIGSDFDKVATVADNIEDIVTMADSIEGLEVIIQNGPELVELAKNLQEHQVSEVVKLKKGNRLVKFNNIYIIGSAIYLISKRADSRRLVEDEDYTIISNTVIELTRSFGSDVEIVGCQTVVADKGSINISDETTVMNRPTPYFNIGVVLKSEIRYDRTYEPMFIYNDRMYYPVTKTDYSKGFTIFDSTVTDLKNGHIIIRATDSTGELVELQYCEYDGRVMPEREIYDLAQDGLFKLLVEGPKDWKPNTHIKSPFEYIRKDSVEYFPKEVPFDTSNTWQSDKDNWIAVGHRESEEVDVTDLDNIPFKTNSQIVEVDCRQVKTINKFTNVFRFRTYTLVPNTRNLSLENSDTLKLINSPLNLRDDLVYTFYIDKNGVARQVA